MTDYADIYSLLFTGIILLFLFLTVYNITSNYERNSNLLLKTNLLTSKSYNYTKSLEEDELNNAFFVNLETRQEYGVSNNFTISMPFLLLKDNQYYIGSVRVS